MQRRRIWVWILVLAWPATASVAEAGKVGGYSAASVTDGEVKRAAAFAVEAQRKALQGEPGSPAVTLELLRVRSAERQVVAGVNFRLELEVKWNGKAQIAQAVVWWQAWRKPDPYRLTSWTWNGG